MIWRIFGRFALISVLAFGGGAGLPLVERTIVHEAGWITPREFSAAVGLSFITPGPVLILSSFVGYRLAGVAGALAATLGSFLIPWALATAVAGQARRLRRLSWLRGFRRGAAPTAVGLLGVTALGMAQHALPGGVATIAISAAALVLSVRSRLHPALIVLGGAALGVVVESLPATGRLG